MKTCCKCKKEKPSNDYWRSSHAKDGLQTMCILCSKERRSSTLERQRDREYHQALKEKRNAYYREYRRMNRDKIRERRKEYLANYRKENASKIEVYMREYFSKPENIIRKKLKKARRRALENTMSDGTMTAANLRALLEFQSNRCKQCGCALFQKEGDTHLDHIIPLSAGGAHSIFNVQWLCSACNLVKGASVFALLPHPNTTHLSTMLK